jgi:hypothetical protein
MEFTDGHSDLRMAFLGPILADKQPPKFRQFTSLTGLLLTPFEELRGRQLQCGSWPVLWTTRTVAATSNGKQAHMRDAFVYPSSHCRILSSYIRSHT